MSGERSGRVAEVLLGAGISLALLCAPAGAAPALAAHDSRKAAAKLGPCRIRGSKLLHEDSRVAVVRGPPLPSFDAGIGATEWNIYSCARGRGGRAHILLQIGDVDTHTGQSIDHVTLAGGFGAFHVVSGSLATDIFDEVRIFNLATGRHVAHDVDATTYDRALTALVLDAGGTAAWTYSSTRNPLTSLPQPPGPPVELWGASATRAAARLDVGAIDPGSVALSATTVSWVDGATLRQAALAGP